MIPGHFHRAETAASLIQPAASTIPLHRPDLPGDSSWDSSKHVPRTSSGEGFIDIPADPWMSGRCRLIGKATHGLRLGPQGVVLDVAAGDGALSRLAASRIGGRLVTHDLSAAACEVARDRGHRVLQGDIRRLPVAVRAADVTIAFEILEHFSHTDAPKVVAELSRVTKPGGTLLLSTPNRYGLESWKELTRYLVDGTIWNGRDQTHVTLYSRRALHHLLRPDFVVEQCYGYYLLPKLFGRETRWAYHISTAPAVTGMCFLLLVVATRR